MTCVSDGFPARTVIVVSKQFLSLIDPPGFLLAGEQGAHLLPIYDAATIPLRPRDLSFLHVISPELRVLLCFGGDFG